MDTLLQTWLFGAVWLGIIYLVLRKSRKIETHHWIFLVVALIIIPWTIELGFLLNLVIYFSVYYGAKYMQKLLEKRKEN